MKAGDDTYNLFSGSASFVVQARDVHGDIHVHLPPRPSTPMDAAAHDLANEVLARSRDQAGLRDLTNPSPIPVAWATEHGENTDHPVNRGNQAWPDSHGLAALTTAFLGLPQRRLVVLGAAGAGKTTLAMLLMLRLLVQRSPDDPVPVLVSLASWNPAGDHLRTWLARQIKEQYPAIATLHGRRMVDHLVRDRRVLPVLDGLDELPEQHRTTAIAMLNRGLVDDDAVILTCRTAEYAATVAAGDVLRSAAVIRARPVPPHAAENYLRRAVAPARVPRWQAVLDRLHTDEELAAALSTPLMVWLARTVYAPADSVPGELADTGRLPNREAIENHLLDGLVPAVYREEPRPAGAPHNPRWTSRQARRWLGFLADHLARLGSGDLAWWQLYRSPLVRFVHWLLVGLAIAVVLVAAALFSHELSDVDKGGEPAAPETIILLMAGVPPGFAAAAVSEALARVLYGMRARTPGGWATPRVFRAFGYALKPKLVHWSAILILCWLVWSQAFHGDLPGTGLPLLSIVVLTVAKGAFLARIDGVPGAGPAQWLRDDRTGVLLVVGVVGLAAGLVFGVSIPAVTTPWFLWLGVWLGAAMPTLGLSAWGCWLLARLCLAASGRMPWRTMTFLRDAHRRDVLRQVGGVYQFRHRLLQERLATIDVAHEPAGSTPKTLEDDTGEFVFVGRLQSAVKLSSAFLLPLLLMAVGLGLNLAAGGFGPLAWVLLGFCAAGMLILPAAYALRRRTGAVCRITPDVIEVTTGRHQVRLGQDDVTEVTVRPIVVRRSWEPRLYGIHVRLRQGAPRPSYTRRFVAQEGWIPLLSVGRSPTLPTELATAITRFAGGKWRPFRNEPS